MLIIKNPKGSFKIRVAAVAIHDGAILLLNEPLIGTYWFLPGGRAEMHESTDETLIRELEEETGESVVLGPMLWVIENFYTRKHESHHTIGFYYAIEIPDSHPLKHNQEYVIQQHEDGIVKTFHFRWHPINDLASIDLRPPCLKTMVHTIPPPGHIHHCVARENTPYLH
jgi:8-oxo-dGTP pyrophosphatase MutT (NUDIX family)